MRVLLGCLLMVLTLGVARAEPPVQSPVPAPRPPEPAAARLGTSGATAPRELSSIAAGRAICGNPAIRGTRIDPVRGASAGCFILNPVKVTAVAGVQLSQPVTVDCPTAEALANWVEDAVKPALADRGGGVAVVQVAGSYVCRPVNNKPGNGLSEHGRGRAIDISGFRMLDGQSVTVLQGWRRPATQRLLQSLELMACGSFGTVLGPNANALHRDHFHLDTANHSDGSICR